MIMPRHNDYGGDTTTLFQVYCQTKTKYLQTFSDLCEEK